MRILGIMDSHLSSAALIEDGVILAAVREEMLTREKGHATFPRSSIAHVLEATGTAGTQVDHVAFGIQADLFNTPEYQGGEVGWKRDGIATVSRLLPRRVLRSGWVRDNWVASVGQQRRRETLKEQGEFLRGLGLDLGHIHFMEHHPCHAATAAYLHPLAGKEDLLIFVCDGYGDGQAGGIWVIRDGEMSRIQTVSFADSMGAIYSRVTRRLGMKPWEHEYKVMGLAPYGKDARAEALLVELRTLYGVVDGRLTNRTRLTGTPLEAELGRRIEGYRFDHVAWALQRLLEECMTAWVSHHVAATWIRHLGLAGGVFLNVKANQAIADLPEVDDLFIMPPAGDDSASIGAALSLWASLRGDQAAWTEATPLQTLFLGPVAEQDLEAGLAMAREAGLQIQEPDDIDKAVAELLAQGHIVARCTGKAEFGPRALGHRSILCPAHDLEAARRLNHQIKQRDFWMPFAATVLDTHAERYLMNPKGLGAAWMILTTHVTDEGRSVLAAAMHPADATTRPQVLTAAAEPGYHALLSHYASLTGRGAILNTSFNKHGEPIVGTSCDAISTLLRTGLRHLALGPYLIQKG